MIVMAVQWVCMYYIIIECGGINVIVDWIVTDKIKDFDNKYL